VSKKAPDRDNRHLPGASPDMRDSAPLAGLERGVWQAAPPRFEDAFIDILGGGPDGKSSLGEKIDPKPDTGAPVIEAENLSKSFGAFTAVRDSSFRISRGEIFGLLGPNGAGKSTTFKMMCGLLRPSSGRASIMGIDLEKSSSRARSRIGYMAQKFSLYGALSVLQNLRFFSGVYGLSGRERDEAVDMMAGLFKLSGYLSANAETLPLGFKQRLALACSVMHQPDVLFLDEPTSGVDPVTRREFWMHINAMVRKGVTVMVTTHFMDEAEYCDRIALIYRGENIATGTPDDLKHRAKGPDMPDPSLEDAFIALVKASDAGEEV
jgi:ABC-2 type transport system ATP-binding protein